MQTAISLLVAASIAAAGVVPEIHRSAQTTDLRSAAPRTAAQPSWTGIFGNPKYGIDLANATGYASILSNPLPEKTAQAERVHDDVIQDATAVDAAAPPSVIFVTETVRPQACAANGGQCQGGVVKTVLTTTTIGVQATVTVEESTPQITKGTTKTTTATATATVHEDHTVTMHDTIVKTVQATPTAMRSKSGAEVTAKEIRTPFPTIPSNGWMTNSSHPHPLPTTAPSSAAVPGRDCRDEGPFTLTFDDLSVNQYFSAFASPYRGLYFSSGWQYVSPSIALPYPPSSSPNVAAFIPELQWPARMGWHKGNGTGIVNDTSLSGTISSSSSHIAQGKGSTEEAPAFTPHSVNFGCAYSPGQAALGNKLCVVTVRGKSATSAASLPSSSLGSSEKEKSMTFAVLPCPAGTVCALANLAFGRHLESIGELTFDAKVDGRTVGWFMDDLAVSWDKRDGCHK